MDREKVIKGLECCKNKTMLWQHDQCPYHGFDEDCESNLHADALALIKEIIHSLDGLTFTMVHIGRKSRHHRKVVRWDERNRRRRLKGLPEKECPYPRIWKACIIERKEKD